MSRMNASRLKDYTTTVTILEHLSDALFILNNSGQIEYANKSALEMLRTGMEKLVGHNLHEFLKSEHQAVDGQNFISLVEQGAFTENELIMSRGKYKIPVVISFGLIRNGRGEIDYIIASARDISIRRNLEQEIQEQQLLALSREKYRELGELAVNMVHVISQPVTSLRLHLELARNQLNDTPPDKAGLNEQLGESLELLNFITQVIQNVRNFANMTEDESIKPVLICRILDEAKRQIAYELSDNNIDLVIDCPENSPAILANPIHLQQVFVSLIKYIWMVFSNAVPGDRRRRYSDHKLGVVVENIQNKWLQIRLEDQFEWPDSAAGEGARLLPESFQGFEFISRQMELSVVNATITTFGGDLKIYRNEAGAYIFVLRLPVDHSDERTELMNLIELMEP